MGCLNEIPATCRAKGYDYCNSKWLSLSTNQSGNIETADGESIITGETVLAPSISGGIVLGSGATKRVIIRVPETVTPADGLCKDWCNSGLLVGIWVGGRSGTGEEPIPSMSGCCNTASGTLFSGKGLFLRPGDQKELFVQKVEEVHVAGQGISGMYPTISGFWGSGLPVQHGFPVTWCAEIINCA